MSEEKKDSGADGQAGGGDKWSEFVESHDVETVKRVLDLEARAKAAMEKTNRDERLNAAGIVRSGKR